MQPSRTDELPGHSQASRFLAICQEEYRNCICILQELFEKMTFRKYFGWLPVANTSSSCT